MKKIARHLLLCAALLALAPAAALAAPEPRAKGSLRALVPYQDRALEVAARYWASDCDVDVAWENGWTDWMAYAWMNDCREEDNAGTVYLSVKGMSRPPWASKEFWWVARCTAVIHEWGHLIGLDHSKDPANVMAPVLTRRMLQWRACGRPR